MEEDFGDLIHRVRMGDHAAAAELVRRYEPHIRRIIRIRLSSTHLRRLLDSTDICQSVLANFFNRAAEGQFELHTPEQLINLLAQMARNKFKDQLRKQHAQRRGGTSASGPIELLEFVADPAASPSRTAADQELAEAILGRLSREDRYLAEQRAQGRDWADLAAELGHGPEALRKRLARSLERLARDLDLEQ
jgi:RNA polymerase sigma-70 factor (ECF subfamily)